MIRLGVAPASTYLLTTTGRKSGADRSTPVTLLEQGDDRWLVSPYGVVGWVHNVRADPQVSLRRGRSNERLYAREVDSRTAGPVLRNYLHNAKITAPFFDVSDGDPVQRFIDEAPQHPVFRLESQPG